MPWHGIKRIAAEDNFGWHAAEGAGLRRNRCALSPCMHQLIFVR